MSLLWGHPYFVSNPSPARCGNPTKGTGSLGYTWVELSLSSVAQVSEETFVCLSPGKATQHLNQQFPEFPSWGIASTSQGAQARPPAPVSLSSFSFSHPIHKQPARFINILPHLCWTLGTQSFLVLAGSWRSRQLSLATL